MILIDSRVGSADLAEPLRRAGLPVLTTQLLFGDIAFEGKGAGDACLDIGIELKKLPDLVASLGSGRLSGHQLPGLRDTYEHFWLLVEGRWRSNAKGEIIVPHRGRWQPLKGGMIADEMEKRLLTLELCGGFHVWHTEGRVSTLRFITTLYRWFTDTSIDSHTSHLTAHTPHSFLPVSAFRASVQTLPGIGPRASLAVERHFGSSLHTAVNAPVEAWAAIETVDKKGKPRRLGTAVASKIYAYCRGRV